MKEITRTKRLEVTHYYLLGYTYREIEEETGISHGSRAPLGARWSALSRSIVVTFWTKGCGLTFSTIIC